MNWLLTFNIIALILVAISAICSQIKLSKLYGEYTGNKCWAIANDTFGNAVINDNYIQLNYLVKICPEKINTLHVIDKDICNSGTALDFAIRTNNTQMIKYLLKHNARYDAIIDNFKDMNTDELLYAMIKCNNIRNVGMLLPHRKTSTPVLPMANSIEMASFIFHNTDEQINLSIITDQFIFNRMDMFLYYLDIYSATKYDVGYMMREIIDYSSCQLIYELSKQYDLTNIAIEYYDIGTNVTDSINPFLYAINKNNYYMANCLVEQNVTSMCNYENQRAIHIIPYEHVKVLIDRIYRNCSLNDFISNQ